MRYSWIRLAPIVQYSLLLPPVGVWTVLSSSVADLPLRTAIDQSLGRLLPHQLTNPTRAHLIAIQSFPLRDYTVLLTVSSHYSILLSRFPRVTHPFATNRRLQAIFCSFDLHVLGLPPALILS